MYKICPWLRHLAACALDITAETARRSTTQRISGAFFVTSGVTITCQASTTGHGRVAHQATPKIRLPNSRQRKDRAALIGETGAGRGITYTILEKDFCVCCVEATARPATPGQSKTGQLRGGHSMRVTVYVVS
ncbi:hypothetical protein C2U69_30165 [Cupriavidus pinatubonensis]|nr:hypothetical protein C2U69_30165 [Cupriavidus pinatubonensis]